jgi:glutamine amidotransferase
MKNQTIVIVDYGMGNIGSIQNMLKHLGTESIVTSSKKEIENAEKLILPGVGHFKSAMDNIKKLDIIDVLSHKVLEEKKPILGICLGMQLMCSFGEEGGVPGLSFIDANVNRFNSLDNNELKVPHMGWDKVELINNNSQLFKEPLDSSKFYFVHSYYVQCNNASDVLTKTDYKLSFDSSFEKENIFGVQFHPEKSHSYGIKLFNNFLKIH